MRLQQLGREQQAGNKDSRDTQHRRTRNYATKDIRMQQCHNADHFRGGLWHHPGPVTRVKRPQETIVTINKYET